jgi:hypothetical protein
MEERPSERYIKHGVVFPPEKYSQSLHNFGNNVDDRNINYETNPQSTYYTPSEIELMKTQIKQAECPICLQPINDDRCRVCSNGHKFHNKCNEGQDREMTMCPVCRDNKITKCNGNYNDVYSGGKNSKKRKNKKRKSKKRKSKKRKSNKNNKTKRNKRKYKRKRTFRGGGTWIDNEKIPEEDICPICHEEFSKTPEQAVYKTDCGHLFHNNCLNRVCETSEKNSITPTCPLCREDLNNENSDQCTDVWAFANKALDTNDLDTKNKAIYENQPDEN